MWPGDGAKRFSASVSCRIPASLLPHRQRHSHIATVQCCFLLAGRAVPAASCSLQRFVMVCHMVFLKDALTAAFAFLDGVRLVVTVPEHYADVAFVVRVVVVVGVDDGFALAYHKLCFGSRKAGPDGNAEVFVLGHIGFDVHGDELAEAVGRDFDVFRSIDVIACGSACTSLRQLDAFGSIAGFLETSDSVGD